MKKSLQLIKLLSSFLLLAITGKAQTQNALDFDGTDDLTITTGASSLIAGSDNISLTCWVYPENPSPGTTSYDGFCGFRNNVDADFYILHYTTTTVEARFRNSAGLNFDIMGTGIQINTWQHLALTYDGSMLRYYRNGVLLDSLAASGNIASTIEDFYMGGLPYQTNIFNLIGKLDEVSLWSKTLSQSEINCAYLSGIDTSSVGLQLYYKCDQGTAGGNNAAVNTLIDSKGHINGLLNNFALAGATSNWVDGVNTAVPVNDVMCKGGSYLFNGQTLTTPGVYSGTFTSSSGCDSVVSLTLTVDSLDTAVTQIGTTLIAHQIGGTYQWVDCNNNFAPIVGVITRAHTFTVSGNYAVILTDGPCVDTSNCYNVIVSGINEYNYSVGLYLSPNPANHFCEVAAPLFLNSVLTLYDITGRELMNQNFNSKAELNVEMLKSGIYILKLCNKEGGFAIGKMVKE